MNAAKLLEVLNQLDETEQIEAKRGSDTGKSILQTICAFANEPALDGGWLLLGVARDEKALSAGYVVEGVDNPDKVCTEIATQCATKFNRPLRVTIKTESLQAKPVIVIHVAEASPQDKPIYFKSTGLPRGAYRRISSTDQRCTEDDMMIFYHLREIESFDAGLMTDASMDDIDDAAVADYRKARADANPDAEELAWTDIELLQAIKAIRRNDSGQWQPTVAGILLFGNPVALRRSFPVTRVDYIRVPGKDWVPDPDQRFDTIEIRAPIFSLLRRAQAAVLDDLPKAFGLEEGALQRTDKPIIPQRALREALVNALMHRNYRTHAPVQIIRYANRLEIRNPGFSLKSPEHLGEPGSMPRNPVLAAVLHETRYAETKGSGIRTIRETMGEAGLAPPLFESNRGQDQFIAQFLFHHFLDEEDVRWLGQFKYLQLSNEEARALIVARETGTIDNATYRSLNRVDPLAASAALQRLRDAGLLTQQGRGSATSYKPTHKLIGTSLSDKSEFLSSKQELLSSKQELLSSKQRPLSSKPKSLSSKLEPRNKHAGHNTRDALLHNLPHNLAARIDSIGMRHPPEQIRELIVELCSLRDWRVEELATLLARMPDTIRQNYLRPLLDSNRIIMTLPDTPNSPLQAYRAA